MERDQLSSLLKRLGAALKHRGPDDQGIWLSPAGTAGLAHVRLAVLDLTSGGHQPMHTMDGNLHISFNGEIYNFRELRRVLELNGAVFRTNSDTEVLLQLYAKHGPAMLPKLRGMFAFAIWDEERRSCFLARDPLGIKPLYFTHAGPRLAFASELRALQTSGFAGRKLNAEALVSYFQMGSVPEPQTLLADVNCLEAGHYLIWEEGSLTKHCYWNVTFSNEEKDAVTAVAHVRQALQDSVNSHFVSDVPVGIFLSGGIDSTALVALARSGGHKNIDTFSIGVDDVGMNEADLAARTAIFFGTNHHVLNLHAGLGQHLFEGFLGAMDQPSVDGLNTYTVSSFARQNGMKVVLSGLGGDELFAGYRSFDAVPKLHAVNRAVQKVPLVGTCTGWALERNPYSARLRRVGSMLRLPATVPNAYRAFRGIFSLHESRLLASHYLQCSPESLTRVPDVQMQAVNSRDVVSECEISLYMRNQLLRDSDVMSMSHGLELRVPLVDRVLFERVTSVSSDLRLRSGKQMLLEAVPEVPAWIRGQQKRGFVFPFEKWLDQQWRNEFAEATRRLPFKKPTWYMRWAVFMLDHWLARNY